MLFASFGSLLILARLVCPITKPHKFVDFIYPITHPIPSPMPSISIYIWFDP